MWTESPAARPSQAGHRAPGVSREWQPETESRRTPLQACLRLPPLITPSPPPPQHRDLAAKKAPPGGHTPPTCPPTLQSMDSCLERSSQAPWHWPGHLPERPFDSWVLLREQMSQGGCWGEGGWWQRPPAAQLTPSRGAQLLSLPRLWRGKDIILPN